MRPPGRPVGVYSKWQWSHFFQTDKSEAFEMESQFGTETRLGHLGLDQLETEDLGDVKNALVMNSFFGKYKILLLSTEFKRI